MKRKQSLAPVVVGSVAAALLVFACSDDKKSGNDTDASAGGTGGQGTGGTGTGGTGTGGTATGGTDASTGDSGDGGPRLGYCSSVGADSGAALIACGQYLVEHIDACADCHSPRLSNGQIDPTKVLAGNAAFADLDPADATKGLLPTPNLTTLASSGWTVADIEDALVNGNRSSARGGGLFPIMPYMVFHNMAPVDSNAIAQYIHQLTPITNAIAIPLRQPLPAPLDQMPLPIPPVLAAQIPNPTLPSTDAAYASAMRGKYLAAEAGICMECHTQRLPNSFSLDMAKAFGGGEAFQVGGPFGTVTSLNITTGSNSAIGGWTAQHVADLLITGAGPSGPICPPMPAGPGQAFGGMTPGDALDIGNYIRNLPAVVNPSDAGVWPRCAPPPPPDGSVPSDSGSQDASDSG